MENKPVLKISVTKMSQEGWKKIIADFDNFLISEKINTEIVIIDSTEEKICVAKFSNEHDTIRAFDYILKKYPNMN